VTGERELFSADARVRVSREQFTPDGFSPDACVRVRVRVRVALNRSCRFECVSVREA